MTKRILGEMIVGLYYLGLFHCLYSTPWYVIIAYIVVGSVIKVYLADCLREKQ